MKGFQGLSRDDCAKACDATGCVLGGNRWPRCLHPLKGGPPVELLNDPATQQVYAAACAEIGVPNYLDNDGASR